MTFLHKVRQPSGEWGQNPGSSNPRAHSSSSEATASLGMASLTLEGWHRWCSEGSGHGPSLPGQPARGLLSTAIWGGPADRRAEDIGGGLEVTCSVLPAWLGTREGPAVGNNRAD